MYSSFTSYITERTMQIFFRNFSLFFISENPLCISTIKPLGTKYTAKFQSTETRRTLEPLKLKESSTLFIKNSSCNSTMSFPIVVYVINATCIHRFCRLQLTLFRQNSYIQHFLSSYEFLSVFECTWYP